MQAYTPAPGLPSPKGLRFVAALCADKSGARSELCSTTGVQIGESLFVNSSE